MLDWIDSECIILQLQSNYGLDFVKTVTEMYTYFAHNIT